jgi:hypothetical protein
MTDFLSVDPGRRTGISLCHYSKGTPLTLLASWDVPFGVPGFFDWYRTEEPIVQFIVYESFDLREGKYGVDLTPVEVIGALKILALELEIPLHDQPPAGRLQAVSDDVLRKFDMYQPGKAHRNERESNRHALVYMKNLRHRPTIEKGWPRDSTR